MIKESFKRTCPCSENSDRKRCTTNRYLLVITKKYSALPIIQGLSLEGGENLRVIFGSSFPNDQGFAQVHYVNIV